MVRCYQLGSANSQSRTWLCSFRHNLRRFPLTSEVTLAARAEPARNQDSSYIMNLFNRRPGKKVSNSNLLVILIL